jgi:V/A-type H+-transporting ATPase subunit I
MIRPRPARWFEILAARDDATLALEGLAGTGAVELEARPAAALPAALADILPLLHQFDELALRYHAYWPKGRRRTAAFPEPPTTTLERCLGQIRAWAREAEPLIAQLQRHAAERAELMLWRRVLGAMAPSTIDFSQLAPRGPTIGARLVAFPPDSDPAFPDGLLVRRIEIDGVLHALVAGTAAELELLERRATVLKGKVYAMPAWLHGDSAENEAYIAARLDWVERETTKAQANLEALHARYDLYAALGDASRLQWVIQNVRALESGDLFCWITGWTSDLQGHRLASALDRLGVRAIVHYAAPPPGSRAPLLLTNPWWARPFEIFSRALGMPSSNEADPSALLAFAVPLMFGYMFGDIGQGLIIAGAGFWLRKRWPLARLFVAGGLAAAAFGVLFGSVFGLHALDALWIAPLDDPLTILLVPLYGGAVLLAIGLLLNAVEAHWRGELRGWLCSEAWLVVVYVGLLTAVAHPPGLVLAAAGALLFCVGRALHAQRLTAALAALAELVERTLQILINTLSFARVGAFALAHAGLSSAIVALMDASGDAVVKALVLVTGNAVVLVLEGLVVSIQTTRLVLFEFFTRFLIAEGRVFRPLPAPPSLSQEN